MAGDSPPGSDPAACPVDHKTRDLWLAQAQAQAKRQQDAAACPVPHQRQQPSQQCPVPHTQQKQSQQSSGSSWWPRIPFFASSSPSSPSTPASPPGTAAVRPRPLSLGTDREVSSIPRSSPELIESAMAAVAASAGDGPVNHEVETGADAASGHWVYPSEKMFFEAMKRKGNDGARVADMKIVVPIHNAVNERAWQEILAWEAPYTGAGAGRCGQPRLASFAGLSDRLSPKARLNTWLGYSAPFDRHDWIVDRCGTRVDYVIDFYAGRPAPGKPPVSFYLDVRPKLNSWEGVKMRALRAFGLA